MSKRRSSGTGSVTYRASTKRWEGRYPVYDEFGRRRIKTISGKIKREVEDRLMRCIVESRGKTFNLQKCETLENYSRYWENLMVRRQEMRPDDPSNYKLRTIETYMYALRKVLYPELGKMRINKITRKDIKLAIQKMNNRFSNTRQCQIGRDAISAVMKLAIEEEKIAENPAIGVVLPKYTRKEKEIWDSDELKLFLKATEGDKLQSLYLLIANCGLRRGEALGLRKTDCDFENLFIHIGQQVVLVHNKPTITAPKTRTSVRDVPITESLSRILQKMISKDNSGCELVFHTANGTPISPRNFERSYRKVVERAGIRYLSPHSLRHSFCTDLCHSGVDLKTNQVLMGHSDPSVTMRVYQHVEQQHKIDAAKRLIELRSRKLGINY